MCEREMWACVIGVCTCVWEIEKQMVRGMRACSSEGMRTHFPASPGSRGHLAASGVAFPRGCGVTCCVSPLPSAHTKSKSHLNHLKKRRKLESELCAAGSQETDGDSNGPKDMTEDK